MKHLFWVDMVSDTAVDIIVFKGGNCNFQKLKKEYGNKCIIAFLANGWMDTDLTLSWTNAVLGQYSFASRLSAWDTYECYLMPVVEASLKAKTFDTVLVRRGCTKYIQAPNIAWNKLFEAICTEKYDEQLEAVGNYQETDAGNPKPLLRSAIVN